MRRPSYLQSLVSPPKAAAAAAKGAATLLTPRRLLMRPSAQNFDGLEIEEAVAAPPRAAAKTSRSLNPDSAPVERPEPMERATPAPESFSRLPELPPAPVAPAGPARAARPSPGNGGASTQAAPASEPARSIEHGAETPAISLLAGKAPTATESSRLAPTQSPTGARTPVSTAGESPIAPSPDEPLGALSRASDHFAKTLPLTPALSSLPQREVLAPAPGPGAAAAARTNTPPPAVATARPSAAPPTAASVRPNAPPPAAQKKIAETLRPLQPLRPPPRPAPREKPSVSIGTLEVRITPPAAVAAPPPPAIRKAPRGSSGAGSGVARPVGFFGFGQT